MIFVKYRYIYEGKNKLYKNFEDQRVESKSNKVLILYRQEYDEM